MDNIFSNLDPGSLADWAGAGANWATFAVAVLALIVAAWGVIFSLLGAVAVAYLGWHANTMSKIAVEHETSQTRKAEALRAEERKLILVSIWAVTNGLRIAISSILDELQDTDAQANIKTNTSYQRALGNRIQDKGEILPDSLRSQLHIVGNPTAAEIVRCSSVIALMKRVFLNEGHLDDEGVQNLLMGMRNMKSTLTDLTAQCRQAAIECGLTISQPRADE